LQAKIALGKVVDNSIAPTECTKARCFDTPNQNFFLQMRRLQRSPAGGAYNAPQRGLGQSPGRKRILDHFPAKNASGGSNFVSKRR